jgi:hypothetical protein
VVDDLLVCEGPSELLGCNDAVYGTRLAVYRDVSVSLIDPTVGVACASSIVAEDVAAGLTVRLGVGFLSAATCAERSSDVSHTEYAPEVRKKLVSQPFFSLK